MLFGWLEAAGILWTSSRTATFLAGSALFFYLIDPSSLYCVGGTAASSCSQRVSTLIFPLLKLKEGAETNVQWRPSAFLCLSPGSDLFMLTKVFTVNCPSLWIPEASCGVNDQGFSANSAIFTLSTPVSAVRPCSTSVGCHLPSDYVDQCTGHFVHVKPILILTFKSSNHLLNIRHVSCQAGSA